MINSRRYFKKIVQSIESDGLFKQERVISSPQNIEIELKDGRKLLNFCSNNYLGLSNHPKIIEAAKVALDKYGFGLASVRFICGTQDLHKKLERKISEFFGTGDTILYSSCFDANGGLFETILNENDLVLSDSLNHASIIDGIRLCKARRLRYNNNDMIDLETKLASFDGSGLKLIATDGVFSMDGHIAELDRITDLAEEYNALVMVDDCHATGFIGKTGRGSAEYHNVLNKVNIFTSTLGKAMGGASGGFTTGDKEIIEILRQRSRPYLFSNTLVPAIIGASIKVFDIISDTKLRDKLESNTSYFRNQMSKLGFDIVSGEHPIVPLMLYDAKLAQRVAEEMLKEGVYVIGFYYPVVPINKARVRIQISAAMNKYHLDFAINAFKIVGKKLGIL
tara:strand:- start:45 stop:1226 length:1182 start_codon:yes stop_codon:yes gene_type:complete